MAKTTRKCTIDNLGAEIAMAVKEYTEEVSAAVEKEVDDTAKKTLADIKAAAPVDTGEYKKGWSRKKARGLGKTGHTIYNKAKPQLAHLLEFGHAKVGGGRVEGKPHIRPVYGKHVMTLEDRIVAIIERGGTL